VAETLKRVGMYGSHGLSHGRACIFCQGLVAEWNSADGISLEERCRIGFAILIIVLMLIDFCSEIDLEDIAIIEERAGFEVNLFVDAEDRGMKVERALPSFPVMPECMYFRRLWAEELFVYPRS